MRLRQEQVVFVASLGLLGLMSWRLLIPKAGAGPSRIRPKTVELVHFAAPPADLALPWESSPQLVRALFSPPRDTHSLAALELVEPPRRPLPILFPPTEPGPSARAYGELLRIEFEGDDLPDLFIAEEEAPPDDEFSGDELAEAAGDETLLQALRNSTDESAEVAPTFEDETPAERLARFEGYRRGYDWIQRTPGDYIFGRIENEERFELGLDELRASEPVLFVQIDPETGREWFENIGAPPIGFEREAIVEFGFAETIANRLELERREIGSELTRTNYPEVLRLAAFAVNHRLEAPRALAVAEELYRACSAYDPEDPEPRLGLARSLEAGFRFEEAFREYNSLVADFSHRAEPHVGLGELEARFLLLDQAEERLRYAVSVNRSSWSARWALGRFLAKAGELEEAVEHLRQASRSAPSDPAQLSVRVGIRVDLADALFALGQIEEASETYGQALSADPQDQRARAGALACEFYAVQPAPRGAEVVDAAVEQTTPGEITADEAVGETVGFELLLARGIVALRDRDFEGAREHLLSAVSADPLRAYRAYGALAFLAEVTGNESEAMNFAEAALVAEPGDPYALYLRGRLLGHQDDYEGARSSLVGALESELDFEDALVALGETAFRLGRFDDAERYLERALSIEEGRPDVHALRGINFLWLGSVPQAREAFDTALRLVPDDPTALAGAAWCTYLDGDVTEALIQLRQIDDRRRDLPEEDPWRVWTRAQITRVQDHVQKVEWRDNFNRKRLINGWYTREGAGPVASMEDGAVKLEGAFDRTEGKTQVYREYPAGDFVSIEGDLWISADSNVRTGIFVARERERRRQETSVLAEASVSRHSDGNLQVRLVRQGQPVELTDMEQSVPTGEWVRFSISRSGESSQTLVTIAMDGVPLIEDVSMPGLGASSSPLLVGLLVEGDIGRRVRVLMDNVAVVYRTR